jgi:hypothetical protein
MTGKTFRRCQHRQHPPLQLASSLYSQPCSTLPAAAMQLTISDGMMLGSALLKISSPVYTRVWLMSRRPHVCITEQDQQRRLLSCWAMTHVWASS